MSDRNTIPASFDNDVFDESLSYDIVGTVSDGTYIDFNGLEMRNPSFPELLDKNSKMVEDIVDHRLEKRAATFVLGLSPDQRDALRVLLDRLADMGLR